jgi:predicted DNA-binding transcriptional regulator AlpA
MNTASWNYLSPEMLKEYMNTEELAKFLGMGVSTIEQLRLNGNGPKFVKFGKKAIRYQVDDVIQWGRKYSSTAEYDLAV